VITYVTLLGAVVVAVAGADFRAFARVAGLYQKKSKRSREE
jgi:hypothetical protein